MRPIRGIIYSTFVPDTGKNGAEGWLQLARDKSQGKVRRQQSKDGELRRLWPVKKSTQIVSLWPREKRPKG